MEGHQGARCGAPHGPTHGTTAGLCEDWQQELGAIKAGVLSASTAALNLFACRG